MNIEIKKTRTDGIIQITTLGERWYAKEEKFNPSITWICRYNPKPVSEALLKYYAKNGYDESKALRDEAAQRGSKVHQAIDVLLQGGKVTFESPFADPDYPNDEKKRSTLNPDEYWLVMTFADWWQDLCANHAVQVVDTEKTVWVEAAEGEQYGYAGTRDIKLIVDNEPWAIDIKSGQHIYDEHELQLSAIKHADPDSPKIFVLQVGYYANKRGWKLTEMEDKFNLFRAAMAGWRDANPDSKPKQKDYPPEISLVFPDLKALAKIEGMKKKTPIAKEFPKKKKVVVKKN